MFSRLRAYLKTPGGRDGLTLNEPALDGRPLNEASTRDRAQHGKGGLRAQL